MEDENYPHIQILKHHLSRLRYFREKGENVIAIRVRESANKTVYRTLMGVAAGLLIGLLLKTFFSAGITDWLVNNVIESIQIMFINVLMMIVSPMIFFAIVDGIINISDAAYIERIGRRLITFSLLKLAFYVAIGLLAGFLIGELPELLPVLREGPVPSEASGISIRDLIVDIVPSTPLSPFSKNNILQLLFLACFLGLMINRSGEYVAWAKDGIRFLSLFTADVASVLSLAIPFLVTTSMTELIIRTGLQGLASHIKILLASAGCLALCFPLSAALIAFIGKISPGPFLSKTVKFSALPFSLSNSSACLPMTLSFCSKKLGMDEKMLKFSLPVGMQFNMDGTAFYISAISMMLVRTLGIPVTGDFLLSLFLVEFFMALTGIGLIIMPPTLASMGIPESAIAYFIGIEPILDMFGTVQSVTGNITSSFVVVRLENRVDEDIYYSKDDGRA